MQKIWQCLAKNLRISKYWRVQRKSIEELNCVNLISLINCSESHWKESSLVATVSALVKRIAPGPWVKLWRSLVLWKYCALQQNIWQKSVKIVARKIQCYSWEKKNSLTLFRMGFFLAAQGWGGGDQNSPPSLKSVTYILQWWNLVQQLYLT